MYFGTRTSKREPKTLLFFFKQHGNKIIDETQNTNVFHNEETRQAMYL
jgi:hypothetical protein